MDLAGQAATFILTIITGGLLGLLFDSYRILRQVLRLHWAIGALADVGYWLVATAVVFGALLISNWGELRLYVFIGLGLGALLYYRLFSCHAIRGLRIGIGLAARLGRAIRQMSILLCWPVRYSAHLTGRLARFLSRRWPGRRPPDSNIPL